MKPTSSALTVLVDELILPLMRGRADTALIATMEAKASMREVRASSNAISFLPTLLLTLIT